MADNFENPHPDIDIPEHIYNAVNGLFKLGAFDAGLSILYYFTDFPIWGSDFCVTGLFGEEEHFPQIDTTDFAFPFEFSPAENLKVASALLNEYLQDEINQIVRFRNEFLSNLLQNFPHRQEIEDFLNTSSTFFTERKLRPFEETMLHGMAYSAKGIPMATGRPVNLPAERYYQKLINDPPLTLGVPKGIKPDSNTLEDKDYSLLLFELESILIASTKRKLKFLASENVIRAFPVKSLRTKDSETVTLPSDSDFIYYTGDLTDVVLLNDGFIDDMEFNIVIRKKMGLIYPEFSIRMGNDEFLILFLYKKIGQRDPEEKLWLNDLGHVIDSFNSLGVTNNSSKPSFDSSEPLFIPYHFGLTDLFLCKYLGEIYSNLKTGQLHKASELIERLRISDLKAIFETVEPVANNISYYDLDNLLYWQILRKGYSYFERKALAGKAKGIKIYDFLPEIYREDFEGIERSIPFDNQYFPSRLENHNYDILTSPTVFTVQANHGSPSPSFLTKAEAIVKAAEDNFIKLLGSNQSVDLAEPSEGDLILRNLQPLLIDSLMYQEHPIPLDYDSELVDFQISIGDEVLVQNLDYLIIKKNERYFYTFNHSALKSKGLDDRFNEYSYEVRFRQARQSEEDLVIDMNDKLLNELNQLNSATGLPIRSTKFLSLREIEKQFRNLGVYSKDERNFGLFDQNNYDYGYFAQMRKPSSDGRDVVHWQCEAASWCFAKLLSNIFEGEEDYEIAIESGYSVNEDNFIPGEKYNLIKVPDIGHTRVRLTYMGQTYYFDPTAQITEENLEKQVHTQKAINKTPDSVEEIYETLFQLDNKYKEIEIDFFQSNINNPMNFLTKALASLNGGFYEEALYYTNAFFDFIAFIRNYPELDLDPKQKQEQIENWNYLQKNLPSCFKLSINEQGVLSPKLPSAFRSSIEIAGRILNLLTNHIRAGV